MAVLDSDASNDTENRVHKVDHEKVPDSARALSEHLAGFTYDNLPVSVIEATKAQILDTIGCAFAGTSGPDIGTLLELARADGDGDTTVWGTGGLKLPTAAAVMVNAATIHQDDFDDTSEFGPSHPTSASFPVALAMAEKEGGKTGRDLILAVALANDVTCRLSRAIVGRVFDHPWFRPPVCGLFGATAAAGVIVGASAEEHYQGFGLSLPMVGGTWASMHEANSSVRAIRDGLAYRNAVLATQMAQSGLRGDPNTFDGKYGLFQAYYQGEYRPEDITSELGDFFETERVSLKPWPSNRLLHNTITAVVESMETNDLHFEDVESVEFRVGFINGTRCYPVAKGLAPDRRIELLPNLPFSVAAAIRHRGIPLALYRDGAAADDVIEVAIPKVRWINDPSQDTADSYEIGRVRITTVSGDVFTGECDKARGHPQNPMTIENRHSKFRDCMNYAAVPVDAATVEAIIDRVEHLESLDKIEELLTLLR